MGCLLMYRHNIKEKNWFYYIDKLGQRGSSLLFNNNTKVSKTMTNLWALGGWRLAVVSSKNINILDKIIFFKSFVNVLVNSQFKFGIDLK